MTFRAAVLRLQSWLFVLPLLAVGCSDGAHTPTEPIPLEQPKAAVTATAGQDAPAIEELADDLRPAARIRLAGTQGTGPAATSRPALPLEKPIVTLARGGNGNGNGNGNGKPNGNGNGNGNGGGNGGGGNGGGNGGGGRGSELKLDIQPATWNTNWVHTEGTVQAFVRGKDATKIDTGSVELVAEGGSLPPTRVRIAGGQFVAHFFKSDAFELLGEADTGETHDVTLRFRVGEETKELTVKIRTVGPSTGGDDDDDGGDEEEDDRTLEIKPGGWNMNWRNSAGQVHAFIRGEGLADIDLDSIVLVGDDREADPVEPLDVRRVGKQIVVRFAKSEAFASLDDPAPGETHTVKIRFSEEGAEEGSEDTETELSDEVRILGSS
ncbi:MAG TPA: hypothetical protein VE685_09530 [Thermoanaerobaculia bacterium]|nr:hypothetical protein [Thermoanaerobaculia bacterium]